MNQRQIEAFAVFAKFESDGERSNYWFFIYSDAYEAYAKLPRYRWARRRRWLRRMNDAMYYGQAAMRFANKREGAAESLAELEKV